MRINGYWSRAGWPAIYALVECPFPYLRGYVEFALDTGSPFSILSQAEAQKLNVNYSKLSLAPNPIIIANFVGRPTCSRMCQSQPIRAIIKNPYRRFS